MASFFARHGAGEILARYSFIEPLLAGRRVLELGAAAATGGASALLLAERGAAAVLSLTEAGPALEAARAAGHHPFVRYDDAPLESLPAGAFDLILLADGAPLADDPARLTALRRLLAEKGHLVTAIPAAGGRSLAELAGDATPVRSPDYQAFMGALTEHFPWVEVATQSASVGYVIAVPPPDGEEAEVSIDGAQAGDAEAAAYLALCGEGPTGLTGITMVALPSRQLLDEAVGSRQAELASAALAGGAVERLEARVAELAGSGEAAAAEVARLAAERGALAAERDALLAARQAAAEEREGLLQDRELAMAGEAEARAELERLARGSTDRAEAQERLAQEHQERTLAQEKLRSVEALCDAEREAGAAARADAERLGGLLGIRERELAELRGQLDPLRQRLAEVELEAARLGDDRTRAVTELAERSSSGVETEAGLRAARAEAQAARSGLETSLARADAAEARVQELEEGLDQRVSELSALRAELESARAALANAAAGEQALRERAEVAEAAQLGARGEIFGLREQAVTARGEAEVALRELDEARGEAARATALLGELRVELRATSEGLEEARRELEAARSGPAAVQAPAPASGVAEPSAEAARLAGERDGLAAQLEEAHRQAEQERERLVAQLDEARGLLQGAADRLRELEAQRASAEAEARQQRERAGEAQVREAEPVAGTTQAGPTSTEELEALRTAAAWAGEELEQARAEAARAAAGLEEARAEAAQAAAGLEEARRAAEVAEGQAAELGAELQAVRWEKEEIEQRLFALRELERDGPAVPVEVAPMEVERATAAPDQAEQAAAAAREAERVVAQLRAELEAVRWEKEEIEQRLLALRELERDEPAEAIRLRGELEATRAELERVQGELATRSSAPAAAGGEALAKVAAEKEQLIAALADRDLRIARLQREVTDKTDRLGRLAAEMGELKTKGIGKIFR